MRVRLCANCPSCCCLRRPPDSHDIVFARGGTEPNGKPFELLDKINAHRSDVCAAVVEWHTGEDIYNHFHRFFSQLRSSGAVVRQEA